MIQGARALGGLVSRPREKIMLEGVPLNLVDVGGWGVAAILAALVVLALVKGRIYPSSTVDKLLVSWRERLDSEKERANTWEEAWRKCQAGHSVEARADRETSLETLTLVRRTLEAIQNGSYEDQEGKG